MWMPNYKSINVFCNEHSFVLTLICSQFLFQKDRRNIFSSTPIPKKPRLPFKVLWINNNIKKLNVIKQNELFFYLKFFYENQPPHAI